MKRMVFVGGFGDHQTTVDRVAEAMEQTFDAQVNAFTFADAHSPEHKADDIRRAARRVQVVTRSAGFMAVINAYPEQVVAFGAPVPTSVPHLAKQSAVKTGRLFLPQYNQDVELAARYTAETTRELVTHPVANMRHLGAISRFDAVKAAISLQHVGTQTDLIYTNDDVYFRPTQAQYAEARAHNVDMHFIPGEHDELVLDPTYVLRTAVPILEQS